MNKIISLSLFFVLYSGFAPAQNMQVIGGSSYARDCYQASNAAALTGSASRVDVENCDNALHYGGLKKRDLIATYVNRGVVHMAMENFTEAAKDYNKALELNPKVAEAYVNRGNLWFMVSRYQEAIEDYGQSLELGFAQTHIALLNRGMVHEITGSFEMAKDDYLQALSHKSEWPIAKQKLERVNKKIIKRDG